MTTIYPFDRLPLHPGPYPLETLTSYLLRLAASNSFPTMASFSRFCFADKQLPFRRRLLDTPPKSLQRLAMISGQSEERLWATTSQSLLNKFNRNHMSSSMPTAFLKNSLSHHLRYCPSCLSDTLYIQLPWRFLMLEGCVHHQCRLLDTCGHCGSTLYLLPDPHRFGYCPNCKQPLHTSPSISLTEEEQTIAQSRYDDLVYLLTPQDWEEHTQSIAASIGPWLAFIRRQLNIPCLVIAQHANTGKGFTRLVECEDRPWQTTFDAYSRYLDILNLNWRDLFPIIIDKFQDTPAILDNLWTHYLVQQAQPIIEQMIEDNCLVTHTGLARQLGIAFQTLQKIPELIALLETYQPSNTPQQWTQRRSQELYDKTYQAIQTSQEKSIFITQKTLQDAVGVSINTLHTYPQVKQLVDNHTGLAHHQQLHAQRHEELLQRVKNIVHQLEASSETITLARIVCQLGLSRSGISQAPYQTIRDFVKQKAQQQHVERLQQRGEELLLEVEAAIQQLQETDQIVTQRTVAQMIGMARSSLGYYPAVQQRLQQIPGRSNSARYKRENSHCL